MSPFLRVPRKMRATASETLALPFEEGAYSSSLVTADFFTHLIGFLEKRIGFFAELGG